MAEFNSYDKARHRVFSRYHLLKTVRNTRLGRATPGKLYLYRR